MLKAIFFATFDVEEGPKLHHFLPPPVAGCPQIIDFRPISRQLIPPPALANRSVTLLVPKSSPHDPSYRVLSYPVCIESEHYPRNAFTFNFGVVVDADAEFSVYLPIIRKLATLFRGLEEQDGFLIRDIAAAAQAEARRRDRSGGNGLNDGQAEERGEVVSPKDEGNRGTSSKLYALLEILLEDLNNYGETQIPIDSANTLNLKLFPTYPPPPPVHAWQVPLATIPLNTMNSDGDESEGGGAAMDLTMARVLPFIDGVNSVKRISQLADADLKLVRKAIRHLLYYGCCILLDIFSFSAIYAPTSTIAGFVEDEMTQQECGRYVTLQLPAKDSNPTDEGNESGTKTSPPGLTGTQLVELYLSLRQGQTVKQWCADHAEILSQMDIRRFITFGVIKGFLYRVHRYAIATNFLGKTNKSKNRLGRQGNSAVSPNMGGIMMMKKNTIKEKEDDDNHDGKEEADDDDDTKQRDLDRFLDGTHCFDEICTELGISERELRGRLAARRDVQVICR